MFFRGVIETVSNIKKAFLPLDDTGFRDVQAQRDRRTGFTGIEPMQEVQKRRKTPFIDEIH